MAREYTVRLFAALQNGLRRESKGSRNLDFLAQCHNAKPTENGLEQPTDIVRRLSFDGFNWPFPQLFRGRNITLLCKEQAVYAIDEDTWDTATNITQCGTLFDISNRLTATTSYLFDLDKRVATAQAGPISTQDAAYQKEIVAGGGAWHFVDMGDAWMLLNATNVIIYSPTIPIEYYPGYQDYIAGYTDRRGAFISTRCPTATGCMFKGRIVTAGFDASCLNDYWGHLRPNEIAWSSIGGGDVFFPYIRGFKDKGMQNPNQVGHSLALGTVNSLHADYYQYNTAGHAPMPFQGSILKVAPLGDDHIMVYGSDGICVVAHYAEPTSVLAPIALPRVGKVGLANRAAVGVGEKHHVFLDTSGSLWHIDDQLQLLRLDYSEYLSRHKDTIVISHDPEEDEFYLATKTEGFALNTKTELTQSDKYSLYTTNQCPTTVARVNGELVGVMFELGNKSVELVSGDMDMGTASIKKVTTIEVGISGPAEVEAAWEYRYTMEEPFTRTDFVQLSPRGTTRIGCAFLTGRLVLRASSRKQFDDINYIDIHYVILDRRSVRGARVNIIDGGSSFGQLVGRG